MLNWFRGPIREVAGALGRRAGTAISAFLLAQGVPNDAVHQAVLALSVIGAIALDLSLSHAHRLSQRGRV